MILSVGLRLLLCIEHECACVCYNNGDGVEYPMGDNMTRKPKLM